MRIRVKNRVKNMSLGIDRALNNEHVSLSSESNGESFDLPVVEV